MEFRLCFILYFASPKAGFEPSDKRQKNKVQNEHSRTDPEDWVDFLDFSLTDLYNDVEYKSCRNTVGNAVAKSHKDAGKECGNRFVKVVPIDILKRGHHHNTNHHQRRGGCSRGNGADERRKKRGNRETNRNNNRGQTSSSAGSNACRAFYRSRRRKIPQKREKTGKSQRKMKRILAENKSNFFRRWIDIF